jgi:hypothetical protein
MSDPNNNYEASKIEQRVKLQWAAETATLGSQLPPMQERALVAFFSQAFELARTDSRPVPHAAAQKKRRHYLEMANRIRADVAGRDSHSDRRALIDAAFAWPDLKPAKIFKLAFRDKGRLIDSVEHPLFKKWAARDSE